MSKDKVVVDQLEDLIDNFGIDEILSSIQEVCWLKEHYLLSNWQDKQTASIWKAIGKSLSKAIKHSLLLPIKENES